jgi:hypothetical protein
MTAKYIITGPAAREAVKRKADEVEEGSAVVFRDSDRTLEQNAIFHALCDDAAKTCEFMGRPRSAMEWKVLFVSGHAKATGAPSEIVAGLEGEWLNIRESTAAMGKRRMTSLIEYVMAYLAQQGVQV